MSKNNIILVVFFCGVIAFLVGYIFKSDRHNTEYETVLNEQLKKKLSEERKDNQNKIQALEKSYEILQDAYLISEKKRKANYKLYENATKVIPVIYTKQQAYSDSLAAHLRQ